MFSKSEPGVTNNVPLTSLDDLGVKLGERTDRIEIKSPPKAMTQAPHLDPGSTADFAASILAAIPPRPSTRNYSVGLKILISIIRD